MLRKEAASRRTGTHRLFVSIRENPFHQDRNLKKKKKKKKRVKKKEKKNNRFYAE